MTYQLKYADVPVETINSEVIEETILELDECEDNTVLLEVTPGFNHITAVEAYYHGDEGEDYQVIAYVEDGETFGLYGYKAEDVREVIKIFLDFYEKQIPPDLSTWEWWVEE